MLLQRRAVLCLAQKREDYIWFVSMLLERDCALLTLLSPQLFEALFGVLLKEERTRHSTYKQYSLHLKIKLRIKD